MSDPLFGEMEGKAIMFFFSQGTMTRGPEMTAQIQMENKSVMAEEVQKKCTADSLK